MFICYYEVHRNLKSFIYGNFTFIPVYLLKFFMYPSWQSSMIQFSQICLLQIIKGKRLNISIYIFGYLFEPCIEFDCFQIFIWIF
jgi:hypothetical protein